MRLREPDREPCGAGYLFRCAANAGPRNIPINPHFLEVNKPAVSAALRALVRMPRQEFQDERTQTKKIA
jgi:hypothetical protein